MLLALSLGCAPEAPDWAGLWSGLADRFDPADGASAVSGVTLRMDALADGRGLALTDESSWSTFTETDEGFITVHGGVFTVEGDAATYLYASDYGSTADYELVRAAQAEAVEEGPGGEWLLDGPDDSEDLVLSDVVVGESGVATANLPTDALNLPEIPYPVLVGRWEDPVLTLGLRADTPLVTLTVDGGFAEAVGGDGFPPLDSDLAVRAVTRPVLP